MKNKLYKLSICALISLVPHFAQAAEATSSTSDLFSSTFLINLILVLVAMLLAVTLSVVVRTFVMVLKDLNFKSKNSGNILKVIALFIFLSTSQSLFALTPAPVESGFFDNKSSLTMLLIAVIVVEVLLIIILSKATNHFMKQRDAAGNYIRLKQERWYVKLWEKMNNLKPIEEEDQIDSGHNYDGIRELDNGIPPWFTSVFVITVIIAIGYLYRYHVAKSAPLQIEEYQIEMAAAEKDKNAQLATQANKVDENTVVMMGASDIEAGKTLFAAKCMVCHGADGSSKKGGVGPNLNDDYWLHNGSIKDVFKSIKYGWPLKGMIAWKDQLTASQIAQLSSFIKSNHGINNPEGKEPQGELYKEEGGATNADSTSVVAKDSLSK